jgi:hypothetical protein
MDAQYNVPVEFTAYRTLLEESNNLGELVIERWTDFKRDFNMEDLSPYSHLSLSTSFLESPIMAYQY